MSDFIKSIGKYGGALYWKNIEVSTLIIEDCNFLDNLSTSTSIEGKGGAIYINSEDSMPFEVIIRDSNF